MTEFIVEADNGKTFSYSERAEAEEHAKKIKRDFDIDAHVRVGGQTDGGEIIEEPYHTVETPEREEYDLPEGGPSVDEDPLVWMPDEFTDSIDGTTAINRKGFEVLAHHYDISATTEMVVSPTETGGEMVVHKATAVDADGDEYSAYGEAHKGTDTNHQMVRMSDTRAYKRAVSRATGVGMIAVEELQNEL